MTPIAEQLLALLPHEAYAPTAPRLNALVRAEALALETANRQADRLSEQMWPDNAEAVSEWERLLALPDPCTASQGLTVRQRVGAVLGKLTGAGGQSKAFFIQLARSLGYSITITEFRPARAGIAVAGDAINGEGWTSAWRVNAPAVTLTHAVAGLAAAGEPLVAWGNAALECRLNAMKPAHTTLLFGYGAE